jgi:hypothetical protein
MQPTAAAGIVTDPAATTSAAPTEEDWVVRRPKGTAGDGFCLMTEMRLQDDKNKYDRIRVSPPFPIVIQYIHYQCLPSSKQYAMRLNG